MRAQSNRGVPHSRIPVAKPSFDVEEERLACEVIRSGWVTQGPKVVEFEKIVAGYVGARESVAVTSATVALSLSLHALGIGAGDEVIVPSLSFIATANAVIHAGATPVFVDIDPATLNIDPDLIGAAVTDRTRAVMPVDQLGIPCDMDRVNEIAARHGLRVIEDAACAIGSRYKGQRVGSAADLACFSFHPRKIVVTGEGGMITTNDTTLAERLRLLRHQGMSVSDLERHGSDRVIIEHYPVIGFNFRLSDILAAVGIAQMGRVDAFLAGRRAIGARYDAALSGIDGVEPIRLAEDIEWNYQSYIARLPGADTLIRNGLLDEMQRRGVSTRRGLMAIHREPCYAGARISGSLEHTDAATDQTFVLPMYNDLSEADQCFVTDQLREAVDVVRRRRGAESRKATS